MPELPTGSVTWKRDPEDGVEKWHARVRAGGKRPQLKIPNVPKSSPDLAKLIAVEAAKSLKRDHAKGGETLAEYAERWLKSRTGRVGTVGHDESHLRLHVFPVSVRRGTLSFGLLRVSEVTREDVEDVVKALDDKVQEAESKKARFGWKTATNVWSTVTKLFDDARSHKDRSLRARDTNPCTDVRGPDRGAKKAKQYLYPSEFLRLVNCPKIPLHFREVYAFLVYTYMRVGEFEALRRGDIDLEHGVIHVTKAVDRLTRKVKSTKSGETRVIPIEPQLASLVANLVDRKGKHKLGDFWIPDPEDRAICLRAHLLLAGVTRATLHADDARSKHITAHDLRATGITWAAVRGDDHLKIMQRAGHADAGTSLLYIREAENLRQGFGEPFPELPTTIAPSGHQPDTESSQVVDIIVEQRGIEPVSCPAASAGDSSGIPESPSSEVVDVGSNPAPCPDMMLEAVAAAMKAGRFDLAESLLKVLKGGS